MAIHDGKPDGYTTLTPFLVCRRAAEAITWYETVLGARLVDRMDGPDGIVMHAELDFGDGRLQLSDPMDAYGLAAPAGADDQVSSSTCVYVGDVDKVFAAAVERGRHRTGGADHLRHRRPLRLGRRPVRPPLGDHDAGRGRAAGGGQAAA